jgi:hypothetical protein
MKKSGTTIVFVIVCVGVLVAAFAIGICIRKIRFGAENESITTAPGKSAIELAREREQARRVQGTGEISKAGELSPEQRAELVQQRAGMRERFENMTEEEKEKFKAQMRERFGGRRRGSMGPQLQLSEEDRAKLREEIDALREKWDQMSEAEREEARNKISEKYGFSPRGLGGGRGFGDGEGGRRRPFPRPGAQETRTGEEQPKPDAEQSENN